jgi:hypothetical protein
MRKLSLLTVGLMLTSLLICSFAMGQSEVKVGKGDLRIGGILQAGFTYNVEDEMGNDSFWLKRARFLFWGTIVPDKVKYFVQLDHRGSISVLDYKAQFFYIEKTEIAMGRFLPNFTLYMPYSTAKLELINYPMTTTKYAVWRQCGIQTTTKTDYVDFNVGIFNGGDVPNNWSDNNDAKDFLVRADVKPPIDEATVRFGGYAWIGFAKPPTSYFDTMTHVVPNPDEETFKAHRFGGFAKADYTKDEMAFRFRGEFIMGQDDYLIGPSVDETDTRDSRAFFGQASVQPVKQVEILARFEDYDPNTDVDDDGMSAITGGVNYYIEGINAMIYVNFIHKMEQGTEIDNDEIQSQAQITF